VSFFASVALSAALHFFASQLPISFIDNGRLIDLGLSFVFATLLFAAIYKVLPDVRIGWRDVWIGAAVTALLFSAGKIAISLYLARSGLASTYGAAGAFVAVLLWIYYSAQIFLFGAEFTQVFARLYGSRRWERTAMTHADDDRHEQRDGEEREEEEVERVGR
jgi:membrane protein